MGRLHYRGFTLIEMLAAMALSTLLMLAAMGVLRTLRVPKLPADGSIPPQVMQLMQWDLNNARRFESQPDGVKLFGLGSLDPVDMKPLQQPTMVTYRISTFGGKSCLMRFEQPMGNSANHETFSQVVCSDVSALSITPIPDSAGPTGDDQPFERNPGKPLPRCVELRLTHGGGGESQVMVCRR